MQIPNSASKIVFILMAMALIALSALGIVEPKDFIMLCAMAFTFYFSKPPTTASDTTNEVK